MPMIMANAENSFVPFCKILIVGDTSKFTDGVMIVLLLVILMLTIERKYITKLKLRIL